MGGRKRLSAKGYTGIFSSEVERPGKNGTEQV